MDDEAGQPPQRGRKQQRSRLTHDRITAGALDVLACVGVAGMTHRMVARAAGLGTAATTYHFDTKADILQAASNELLQGYIADFERLEARLARDAQPRHERLGELADRVVMNAVVRDRKRSLAWCEIVLNGGRAADGRGGVRQWYAMLDPLWARVAGRLAPDPRLPDPSRAVDMVVGLIFMLHPLSPSRSTVAGLLDGSLDLNDVAGGLAPTEAAAEPAARAARERVVEAAIAVLIDDGPAQITYHRVARQAGLARSGPAHHFPRIDALLETAQHRLFQRAKERFRGARSDFRHDLSGRDAIVNLTETILRRESLDFAREGTGYYSAWVGAAQGSQALRRAVANAITDQHRGWCRRLEMLTRQGVHERALRCQALFIGMQIRAITAGVADAWLAAVPAAFGAMIAHPAGAEAAPPAAAGATEAGRAAWPGRAD